MPNVAAPPWRRIPRDFISLGFLLLMALVFSSFDRSFLSLDNIRAIELSAAILLVAACGSAFVILMGSIDLSTGPIASMAGMAAAALLPTWGLPALVVGPAIGLLIGLLNGVLFINLRIPSIISTLGMGTVLGGLVFFISDGQSIAIYSDLVQNMTLAGPRIVPLLLVYAVAIFLGCIFINQRTRLGRTIFALGGDERAVLLLGAPDRAAKRLAFALSGLLAGVAGTLLASRLGTAASQMGTYLTLDAITAVVVGGISILGGAGSLRNVLIGVLIIVVLSNGMNILSIHPYLQTVIKGAIIVLAVLTISARPGGEEVK